MNHVCVIGEIGQNHNGSVDIAKLIVDLAARPIVEDRFGLQLKPMDAVKLTKRDLSAEMSGSMMRQPYNSIHSFGKTYGEHRNALELSDEQHYEVYCYAKQRGLDFVETLCAPSCLSLLRFFTPDHLKIASRDLTNTPLLTALAETSIPMILSTGMTGKRELDEAIEAITRYHSRIAILHCVSEYPAHPTHVNLNTICYLRKQYSEYTIGYSDHTIGISAAVAAVALGATVLEKHITIDRKMKGTDQAGSLESEGIRRMMRDIRCLEMSIGVEEMFIEPSVQENRLKLERSVATKRYITRGEIIRDNDIQLLSPGDGIPWVERDSVIGSRVVIDIPANEIIYRNMITNDK